MAKYVRICKLWNSCNVWILRYRPCNPAIFNHSPRLDEEMKKKNRLFISSKWTFSNETTMVQQAVKLCYLMD